MTTTNPVDPYPAPTGASEPAQNPGKDNVLARFAGALFSPGETFERIARRPDVLWPLIIMVVIGYISTAVIVPRLDLESMAATQAEQIRKKNPNLSDADLERIQKFGAAGTKVTMWIAPVLSVLFYMLIAGVLLLAFRMMGGEGTFKQALSSSIYAWTPMLLFSIIMLVVVLARGTFDPMTAATIVKSNPAFLVDMKEQPILFSLLGSFDIFTIWTVVLLIFGFATLARTSKGKAAGIVISLWVLFIVIKLGFAALGSMNA
jgi:hypothetical protein